ncbi:hypothetical protein QFW77_07335 [Luteimonas sp. RD2P54]|uniref:Glycosyltransferase RgtA/B/C/D-like domain-containing protein n=1 Tax=Luteimonas endophytica TaxID=3042023 RepID=A0ABT6J7K1_9GAMM|nr:hypothetical protein [Luteimonas endophytica]MDH5822806.1 hypothetical protein [Luteimonas endophytica]
MPALPSNNRKLLWTAIAATQWALLMGLGTWLALWWQPAPHSDWGYYWAAAGDVAAYERGGLSLWLLAVPKALGWSPVASALALNLPAATAALGLAWHVDPTRWRVFAQLTAAYLLLITPFFGIVQLDLISAAQLGLGMWLAFGPGLSLPFRIRLPLAAVAIAFAVSTKPQYALVVWALVPMALALMILRRGHPRAGASAIYGVLLAGSLLGFATDMAMRQASGRTEQIRTSSAVTLYAGLLVSSDRRDERCGYWSVAAAQAARQDLDRSMLVAARDRLSARPLEHWISVVACKAPQIVSPPPYALYWLIESPNIRARIDTRQDRERLQERYLRALGLEQLAYRALTLTILIACGWTAARSRRAAAPPRAWLPVLWILAFWVVHTVFEIQGRYFLGMFLLAPLLCGLVLRQVGRRSGPSRAALRTEPATGGGPQTPKPPATKV